MELRVKKGRVGRGSLHFLMSESYSILMRPGGSRRMPTVGASKTPRGLLCSNGLSLGCAL